MPRFFGTAEVVIDGETVKSRPGAELDIGGPVRSEQDSPGAKAFGFSETQKQASLTVDIMLAEGDSLDRWRRLSDTTITFRCDTGQSYVIRGAYCKEPPTGSDGDNAQFRLVFGGNPAEEVIGA